MCSRRLGADQARTRTGRNLLWVPGQPEFVHHPVTSRTLLVVPFGLGPGSESAGALLPRMDVMQLAWPFTKLTGQDLDSVIRRWAGCLADADWKAKLTCHDARS